MEIYVNTFKLWPRWLVHQQAATSGHHGQTMPAEEEACPTKGLHLSQASRPQCTLWWAGNLRNKKCLGSCTGSSWPATAPGGDVAMEDWITAGLRTTQTQLTVTTNLQDGQRHTAPSVCYKPFFLLLRYSDLSFLFSFWSFTVVNVQLLWIILGHS